MFVEGGLGPHHPRIDGTEGGLGSGPSDGGGQAAKGKTGPIGAHAKTDPKIEQALFILCKPDVVGANLGIYNLIAHHQFVVTGCGIIFFVGFSFKSPLRGVQLVENGAKPEGVGAHQVLSDGSAVFVPLGSAIDVERECRRLGAELERLDKQLATVKHKLANQQFVTRAPADVVEREREKEQSWHEQRETLAIKLRDLGC